MSDPSALFRRQALARLSSPEQLNQAVRITTPTGWWALAAIGALLLAALLWGFVGRIPSTVGGRGILLRGGRVTTVFAAASGTLAELDVKIGDMVEPGQVVGLLAQPVLQAQVDSQANLVRQLSQNLLRVKGEQDHILADHLAQLEEERASARTAMEAYRGQVESLQQIVAAQQKLLDQGLITQTTFIQTKGQLSSTQLSLLNSTNQLDQLATQETGARNSASQTVFSAESQLHQAQAAVDQIQAQVERSSRLVSGFRGQVVSLSAFVGTEVAAGSGVVTIECLNDGMQAVLFLPAGQGKSVHVGMTAQIYPSTAPASRYGFMRSRVSYVAKIPASEAAMDSLLATPNLVSSFLADGPLIMVHADLEADPATASGFRWSSSQGPSFHVTTGTLADAKIVTLQEPPIVFVIPLLRRLFGIEE